MMNGLEPILCSHLIRRVDDELIPLLRSLTAEEWDLPTVAPRWRVHDVAAHLLDTALRKLSRTRDGYTPPAGPAPDVVTLVNGLNQDGVRVYGRLSAPVLIDLLTVACEQTASFYESLDPLAPASIGVSWAGETSSLNWFDTARELTERWHHQQQIRLATDRPGIMTPELYHPVLDCFLRGLPHHYCDTEAPADTLLLVEITGACGGQWLLEKQQLGWSLAQSVRAEPAAHLTIPQELAWRLFTKGLDRTHPAITIEGDRKLGENALHLTAIVG